MKKRTAGFLVLSILALMGASIPFTYASESEESGKSRETREKRDYTLESVDVLIKEAYQIAAGEDRITDAKEKRTLLDKLGFKEVILDEAEVVSLSPNPKDSKQLYVNLESGKFGRYMGSELRGTAGMIPIGVLENYVKSKGK